MDIVHSRSIPEMISSAGPPLQRSRPRIAKSERQDTATTAKKPREMARSFTKARKHAPCSMRRLSCLTASSESAPICRGKRRSRAQIMRARRGAGGAKRGGRFSRQSEGGHLKVYLFRARLRLFASTVFRSLIAQASATPRPSVWLFARTSVQKGSASRRTSTIHNAPLFHARPEMEIFFLFL